jgi:MFS family permease
MSSSSLCDRGRYNVIVVALSFLISFSAYNTLQNYATSLFPGKLGNESLTVLYVSVAVTIWFGPPFLHLFGSKWTMVIGSSGYVLYMLSLVNIIPVVVLLMSFVIGFGAAILWIALGVWITENSTKTNYGQNTGIFWSIFQLSLILGNLAAYFILPHLVSTTWLYIGFTLTGAVGTLLLLLLRKPVKEASEVEVDAPSTEKSNVCNAVLETVKDAMKHAIQPSALLLFPLYFFSGFELSFWSGEYTQLLSTSQIGLIMSFAGIGEVLGGVFMGKLGDLTTRGVSVLVGVCFYSTALGISCFLKISNLNNTAVNIAIPCFGAFCFGLGDSAFNTNLYAMCSDLGHYLQFLEESKQKKLTANSIEENDHQDEFLLEDKTLEKRRKLDNIEHSTGAFTVFQLIQNLGSAAGFFFPIYIPLHDAPNAPGSYTLIYLQVAMIVLSIGTFLVLDRQIRKSRKSKEILILE